MHADGAIEGVTSLYLDGGGGGDGDEGSLGDNCVDIFCRTFVPRVNSYVIWFLIHCQVPKLNG